MTSDSVSAFCPGHISGYFRRIDGNSPAETGSVGAGIVISEGVTATVSPARETSIIIRTITDESKLWEIGRDSLPISFALDCLGVDVCVETVCRLPIGAGFGLSAAALLATLTATNKLLFLGLSFDDIAQKAHETEVRFRTGLGDVAACQGGGRVVRTSPGIHGSIARSFDLTEPLCAVSFGPIHTPSVLGSPERMVRVSAAFPHHDPVNYQDFFSCCREFSAASGLETEKVRKVLATCDSACIPAAMTMLGEGVFAYGNRACEVLAPFGQVYSMKMAETGVRLLEDKV